MTYKLQKHDKVRILPSAGLDTIGQVATVQKVLSDGCTKIWIEPDIIARIYNVRRDRVTEADCLWWVMGSSLQLVKKHSGQLEFDFMSE